MSSQIEGAATRIAAETGARAERGCWASSQRSGPQQKRSSAVYECENWVSQCGTAKKESEQAHARAYCACARFCLSIYSTALVSFFFVRPMDLTLERVTARVLSRRWAWLYSLLGTLLVCTLLVWDSQGSCLEQPSTVSVCVIFW